VFLVKKHGQKEKSYAMKMIPKRLVYEKRLYEQLVSEKKILADVKHRFLVDLAYAFQDKVYCYFVMDYAAGGDVYSLISHSQKYVEKGKEFRSLG
jgi:serine/threonine protein kinase